MKIIKKIITAFSFLTVIPLKTKLDDKRAFAESMAYYPFVGAAIGGVLYFFCFIFKDILPAEISAVIVCGIWLYITGALHTEGFADTLDGLSASNEKNRILAVMKDKNIGAKGAVWTVFLILAKIVLVAQIIKLQEFAWLIGACAVSRWAMVAVARYSPYAREEGGMGGIFIGNIGNKELITATIIALIAGVSALEDGILVVFGPVIVLVITAHYFFKKKLGGVTGDILGAVNETAECLAMLMVFF